MEGVPADVEAVDALDESRLADVLDSSPERIHSDPLPSKPAFPDHTKSEDTSDSPSDPADSKDHHISPPRASTVSSTSPYDPEPGFAQVSGDVGGSGYNETRVDIITVPCPGADPVETWVRDPLPEGYFGNSAADKGLAGEALLSPGISGSCTRTAHLWVKQGIRRYASTARVLLYRHGELTDTTNLDSLARDLLNKVLLTRDVKQRSRPLFFIAHSIGGLVVKKALLLASQDDVYRRAILYNCHGVTFFATPHRGSSYLAMHKLSESIQSLLHLHRPLPRSLVFGLRVGCKSLLKMHDEFTDISSEMRIWTFYENIDSRLSGSGLGLANEVQFSAPLVSIKSALVGVSHELIYSSLQSDHAHCASFGSSNPRALSVYLIDLAAAIAQAEALSYVEHTPLALKEKVKVEMIGFYDDPEPGFDSDIRLYIKKSTLAEFLRKGPERCLEERLRHVPQRSRPRPRRASDGRPSHSSERLVDSVERFLRNVSRSPERPISPGLVLTPPSAAGELSSTPLGRRLSRLTIPVAESPLRGSHQPSRRDSDVTTSTMSEPIGQRLSMDGAPDAVRQEYGLRTRSDNTGNTGLGITAALRSHRTSVASALHDMTAGFSRPNQSKRKFMWIHVPFTNPVWVKNIFDTLSETHKQDFSKLFNNENWVSKHVQGRHSESQPSFVRPAVNYIASASEPSPRPSHCSGQLPNPNYTPTCLYVYLPYLHFDTYRHIVRRRDLIARRLSHGRARPVPKDIAALDSLELRMIWEYVGHEQPSNNRRTLDQFGYPSLKDTKARDDDQMLYKLTKEGNPDLPPASLTVGQQPGMPHIEREYSHGTKLLHELIERENELDSENEGEPDIRDGNLLMVDQLWLWAINTTTLTTFFPQRESRPSEGAMFQQADLRNSIYNELNGDLTGRCENALDLAAFTVLHAVTVLLDRSSHPNLDVFRIFEEAIGMLTERMTSNLKNFRMQTFRDFEATVDDELEDKTAASIKQRHKREIQLAVSENRHNTSALLELRDMEDELKTLYRLFDTQTAMVNRMVEIYSSDSLKSSTQHGQSYLHEALSRLAEYRTQTTEMLDRVGATRGDYEKLLEMAQRQAQVDDVRWSRLQTELASSQNLSVLIFTIFTVIFLPLSFFTSLFGMNTFDWAGDPASAFPTLGTIGAISLPASALVILATLIAAFSARVQVVFKAQVLAVRRAAAWVVPPVVKRERERRHVEKEERERAARERAARERGYDFWAVLRRQRTRGSYEIPKSNRALRRAATGWESSGSMAEGMGMGMGMGMGGLMADWRRGRSG